MNETEQWVNRLRSLGEEQFSIGGVVKKTCYSTREYNGETYKSFDTTVIEPTEGWRAMRRDTERVEKIARWLRKKGFSVYTEQNECHITIWIRRRYEQGKR